MESSIAYDFYDDEIYKMFYIDQNELDLTEKAQLWIYAKCFGTKNESTNQYTHAIINKWGSTSYYVIQEFRCYEQFDYDDYHWQMFEFPKEYLKGDQWNQIKITDCDSWTYNNIRIGIDNTYGGTPNNPDAGLIEDFDRSYWYSGGAGVTPDDPTDNCGELMIKLELFDIQHDDEFFPEMDLEEYWHDYYPYNGRYIPIDYSDDAVRWIVELSSADLSNSEYARLYIYGYSWIVGSPPPCQNKVRVNVNGNYQYFDPDTIWSQTSPIGHWGWISISPSYLQQGLNYFTIEKGSTEYRRHNIAIIMFEEVDSDHSAWYYNTGSGTIGDLDLEPSECEGELGIFLLLPRESSDQKRVGGFELGCEYDPISSTHGWDSGAHGHIYYHVLSYIVDGFEYNNGLEDYGWDDKVVRDYAHDIEPHIFEGLLASEMLNDVHSGDDVDLLIACGHGYSREIQLEDNDWAPPGGVLEDSGKFTKKDITITAEGYPETDHWGGWKNNGQNFWTGYSEDGLNNQADWVLFLNCYVLRGSGSNPLNPDSPWQFILYHGAHSLMGFATIFGGDPGELQLFAKTIVNRWCVQSDTVIDGFKYAVLNELPPNEGGANPQIAKNRYMIYYHERDYTDDLNPRIEADFDFLNGFEDHSTILCEPDDRGMAPNPPEGG